MRCIGSEPELRPQPPFDTWPRARALHAVRPRSLAAFLAAPLPVRPARRFGESEIVKLYRLRTCVAGARGRSVGGVVLFVVLIYIVWL